MLTFHNLSLSLDDKPIIRHASGQILANQIIVLTGASGSGKSLLLKILSSLITPSSGELSLHNQRLGDVSAIEWRKHIAFVSQHSELVAGDVLYNLQLPFGFKHHQARTFCQDFHLECLQKLHKSADFLRQDIYQLSGGERQMVNILRHLQLMPSVLLLDEPTAALDETSVVRMEQLLMDWQRRTQNSLLWVSHSREQCQRLLALGATHWRMAEGVLDVV